MESVHDVFQVVEAAVESVDDMLMVGIDLTRKASMFFDVKAEYAVNFDERDSSDVMCVDVLIFSSNCVGNEVAKAVVYDESVDDQMFFFAQFGFKAEQMIRLHKALTSPI